MVCNTQDFLEWKDFPKGLKVLLLDKDVSSASEIRSKLEGMDYVVSTFYHEDEALSAVHNNSEVFNVAIVEVDTIDCDGSFKFLRMVKGIPTIMIADTQCVSTMMKCISLGAIEVLNKPLSEDKLCSIWQHVLHKAGSPGMVLMINEKEQLDELRVQVPCTSIDICDCDYDQDRSSGNDKYPAPVMPQLKQVKLQDDAGCNNQTNWSSEKGSAEEHYKESKSVETTCCNVAPNMLIEAGQPMHDAPIKEENDTTYGCKSESDTSYLQIKTGNARTQIKASESRSPCGPNTNRKKMKVDWTTDLHKKFVQAVEQLGVDQAIPSRILERMKVEGLTRHNVASHLQKYRMQRRHALPKKEERRIALLPKDTVQSNYYYQHKQLMTYPPQPYNSNQTLRGNPSYPMWVQPGGHPAGFQTRGGPHGSTYQNWPWKSYPAMQADVWGCPVMPSLHGSYSHYPQNVSGCYSSVVTSGHIISSISPDDPLADEVIDRIIKEAINKPWVPLPIGLKPPSTESVLVELSKQGISNIPPHPL